MSSRTSRKSKNPRAKAPEPIITRNKSAQQRRQLKTKEEKKTDKPELTKPEIKSPRPETKSSKPETKSPNTETKSTNTETKSLKTNKAVKRPQVSLLRPIKPDEVLEQIEYYPNTLKREFRAKKIMLKPKHNFKIIASTNKRKMGTPQKGMKSPSSKNAPLSPKGSRFSSRPCSSPELSMQDMVRMMEETRSLSDEDFMEILTCPSPVWWEDPPDGGIDEGTIHKIKSEPPPKKIRKETKKRKITSKTTKRKKKNIIINLEDETVLPKEKPKNSDERFVKKKQKLENILGIIKNKAVQPKKNGDKTTRKISESEGDFSDLSFNEEEILKSLENMDIPIEESITESTEESLDETVSPKSYNADRKTPGTCIPVIKEVFSIKSSVFDSSDFKSDVSSDDINFQSDTKSDEIVCLETCTNSSLCNNVDSSSIIDLLDNNSNSDMGKKSGIENNSNLDGSKKSDAIKNDDVPTKKTKVLSEYINVYKITPDKQNSENNQDFDPKPTENTTMVKLEAVRGKLNDFFKQCKSNRRLKKTENATPANPVTDVKEAPIDKEKENGDSKIDLEDEKNRLKSCDYCIQKTENGTKDFSCEKCVMAPILPCGLCNFLADTKEVFINHVSSCKDVARISWSHNYVLNQT